jgi:hypothetical protein
LTVSEQWRDRRNAQNGYLRKRATRRKTLFIPRRTSVIGRKEASRTETVVHVFQIRGTYNDIVASVKWIGAETIVNAEFDPGSRA